MIKSEYMEKVILYEVLCEGVLVRLTDKLTSTRGYSSIRGRQYSENLKNDNLLTPPGVLVLMRCYSYKVHGYKLENNIYGCSSK